MLKSFILTLALSALGAGWAQAQSTHAFTNARIVPISGPVIEKGTLVVREGKIVAVGASVPVPAGAETHDLAGKTIMPGLVDTHSHIASPAGADASAPIQPDVRVLDSVNVRSTRHQARAGRRHHDGQRHAGLGPLAERPDAVPEAAAGRHHRRAC